VMTNLRGKTHQIKKSLGNLYRLRTWVEYSFRQCEQKLGWADYRFTKFEQIELAQSSRRNLFRRNFEKWWEIIMSAYLMISLNTKVCCTLHQSQSSLSADKVLVNFPRHQQWNSQGGWKHTLNNLRLLIQPIMLLWLIFPWLDIFPNRHLLLGFHQLIDAMNQFHSYFPNS
ncbi:MAG: hypothetical protein ACFB4I_05490, partial [Cyanophyceae cyanobacterium]